jgi:hypothetical protein
MRIPNSDKSRPECLQPLYSFDPMHADSLALLEHARRHEPLAIHHAVYTYHAWQFDLCRGRLPFRYLALAGG